MRESDSRGQSISSSGGKNLFLREGRDNKIINKSQPFFVYNFNSPFRAKFTTKKLTFRSELFSVPSDKRLFLIPTHSRGCYGKNPHPSMRWAFCTHRPQVSGGREYLFLSQQCRLKVGWALDKRTGKESAFWKRGRGRCGRCWSRSVAPASPYHPSTDSRCPAW